MLWVLIRSTSMRRFWWISTIYVFVEKKRLGGRVVCGSRLRIMRSQFKSSWRQNSTHGCMALHSTEPFILTFPSRLNMTNNNETDIKHQIIIIIIIDDDDNDLVFHVRIIIIHREIRKNNFLIPEIIWRPFSPFHWFKKGSCQFLEKECAQYWLTAYRTMPAW